MRHQRMNHFILPCILQFYITWYWFRLRGFSGLSFPLRCVSPASNLVLPSQPSPNGLRFSSCGYKIYSELHQGSWRSSLLPGTVLMYLVYLQQLHRIRTALLLYGIESPSTMDIASWFALLLLVGLLLGLKKLKMRSLSCHNLPITQRSLFQRS